jgi:hypothetical protein
MTNLLVVVVYSFLRFEYVFSRESVALELSYHITELLAFSGEEFDSTRRKQFLACLLSY